MVTTDLPTSDEIVAYQAAVYRDPLGWMRTALGVQPWARQQDVILSLRDNSQVAVRSGHAIGKSHLAAACTAWYLETHNPGYVILTSSAWPNIKKILWPELRTVVEGAPCALGGKLMDTVEWRRGDKWGAFGVSTEKPENFSGFRPAGGVLVIIDEASAVRPEIQTAIMGLMATGDSMVLMLGNPLRPEGPFYDAFKSPDWACHHISSLESPNVVAGHEVIPGLATRKWVEGRKAAWGEDSPVYKARVLGDFPESAADALVPLHWAEAALIRPVPAEIVPHLRLGVDVARFGADRTALVVRDARAVRHVESHSREDTMQTTGRVLVVAKAHGVEGRDIFIDDTGLGGGVTDRLHELGVAAVPVNFGSAAYDPERFLNVRAESYWAVRDALNPEGDNPLAVPAAYGDMVYECTGPHYGFSSKGQIKLESKDELKKRTGRSPDLADALALTYSVPVSDVWIGGGT